MTEIRPDIHQLQIPIPNNPLGYTNIYLVQDDDGYLLIDAGVNTEEALESLKKQLAEISIGFEDITRIVVTHSHRDHYGLSGRVKQLSQAKILVHHLARDTLRSMQANTEERSPQMELWLRLNGVPSFDLSEFQRTASRIPPFIILVMPDVVLHGGETISAGLFNLKVVWTPGHSPGHICLYEPAQKILFAGDHVLPVITPHVSLQTQSEGNPLADFLNSLQVVKQLDVNLVLPAHEQIFTNLQTRVEEIIQHHEQRNLEILKAIKAEPKTAYQISNEITWMPELGGVRFQDLALWHKRMAVSETLAHLKAMEVDGKVTTFSRDSIIHYRHN